MPLPTRTLGVQRPRVLMTYVLALPCKRSRRCTLPVSLLLCSGIDVGVPNRRRHLRHHLLYVCHWVGVVQLASTVAFDLALSVAPVA
eukprot:12922034-Prorocentrum_lima.AAC.1